MKSKYQFILVCIFSLGINVSFFSCKKTQEKIVQLPEPQIVASVAKIHGKLTDPKSQLKSIILRFNNPVTATESIIETQIEKDGSFYFETPIECSPTFCGIYFPGYGAVLIELFSDEDKEIDLSLDYSGRLVINNVSGNSLLTNQDIKNYAIVTGRYYNYNKIDTAICRMTQEEYAKNEMMEMQVIIDYALNGIKFSDAGKIFVLNELKILHLKWALLPYKERLEGFCRNLGILQFQEPDIHYYTFLKYFDLNNPQYLYCTFYSEIMQRILSRKAFNIPPIADTSVEEWINKVKLILSDLVGFDSGQFYDLLAAHSFVMHLNDDVTPLSDKQINNIKDYFGDGEIAKILYRKNEEIIKLVEEKGALIVNNTPEVSKNQLMNAIILKHRGNVVLVDFWATWCGPCLDAMTRFNSIKGQLKDKGVVFVYITNGSSPKELWDKKINSIPGEHYYLKADEWEYLMKNSGFTGIPSYLIFDKKGIRQHKFTSYPGNEEIKAMIDKLL